MIGNTALEGSDSESNEEINIKNLETLQLSYMIAKSEKGLQKPFKRLQTTSKKT